MLPDRLPIAFWDGLTLNRGFQGNSRVLHLPSMRLAVLPAKSNFQARWVATQSSTLHLEASSAERRVALLIYETQSSSGALATRTIHRSIRR